MSLLRGKASVDLRKVWSLALLLLVLVIALAGCGSSGSNSGGGNGGSGEGGTLTILAASSLTDGFAELGNIFEQQNPGTTVKTSLGASSGGAGLRPKVNQGTELMSMV